MNFTQLLLILRARSRIVLFTLAVTVLTTMVVSLLVPRAYKATATLVLNYKGVDPVTGVAMPAPLMSGYMSTQVDIIKSKNTALHAVDAIGLERLSEFREDLLGSTSAKGDDRDRLADRISKKISAVPSRNSSVLDVSFKASDPHLAADIVNAVVDQHKKVMVELKVEPVRQASTYFNEQTKVLRDNLKTAQSKLFKYQQEKGLVSVEGGVDVENARLNELSTQLVSVQGELTEALAREAQIKRSGPRDSPDVLNDPLLQDLRASLAQAEAKLSEVSERFLEGHHTYQAAMADVTSRRATINRRVHSIVNGIQNKARILQRREIEVRRAVDAQRAKVLELNRSRDELMALARDVEGAQRVYDATVQRFHQMNLEGRLNQTDVAVLNYATPPFRPFSPAILINAVLSVFLGLMMGLGFAILAEIRDRRVRSPQDLVELLQLPVLGVIGPLVSSPRSPDALASMWPRRLLGNRST